MTINGDWFWDQYEVTNRGGELDLSNDQTTYLDSLSDLDKNTVVDYENRFIDELYGTDDAKWEGERLPYNDNTGQGALRTPGGTRNQLPRSRDRINEDSMVTWGLDLQRTMVDDDGNAVNVNNRDDYYNHITKGEVDWAFYENDNRYQKAFRDMKQDSDNRFDDYGNPNDISFLTDDDFTDQQRVDFIRSANERLDSQNAEEDPNNPDWKNTWDGKLDRNQVIRLNDETGEYDPKGSLYIDGERQETLKEKYADGRGRLKIGFEATNAEGVKYTVADDGTVDPSAYDPISGPPTAVIRPNIRVVQPRVRIPNNIPASWGGLTAQTTTHHNVNKIGGKS